jgi:hypothetical protein
MQASATVSIEGATGGRQGVAAAGRAGTIEADSRDLAIPEILNRSPVDREQLRVPLSWRQQRAPAPRSSCAQVRAGNSCRVRSS